ncbi:MAG: CHAT domain-containing protein [Gemmatimonadetes bacterium]|nr:CHAT domain-containing protein [Gemmatimonadota bacterium]
MHGDRTTAPLGVAGDPSWQPYPRSLPWSGAEAVQVAKAFDRVERLTGAAASKANLSAAMNRVEVIHVATHASLNADNPLFSRIDLAPGGDGDGRLEVHEIDGLRTTARLVFLSGCETARRAPIRSGADPGEDLATLALAFHRAGAANVVATLWRCRTGARAHLRISIIR